MTTIKTQLLTISTLTFLVSCGFYNSQNDREDYDVNYFTSRKNSKPSQDKKLKIVKVYDDTNGLVILHFPIPKNWNYNADKNAEFMLTAPNNIKVTQAEP